MRSLSRNQGFGLAEAAIAGLGLAAAISLLLSDEQEAAMFGLAFLGLAGGWALGMPRRSLLALALTVAALSSALLLGGFGQARVTSTLAHGLVGAMLAWGLAPVVWSRLPGALAARRGHSLVALVAVVIVLGVGWEIGEQLADLLRGTTLSLGLVDTLGDLLADAVGALIGGLVAARLGGPPRTEGSQHALAKREREKAPEVGVR